MSAARSSCRGACRSSPPASLPRTTAPPSAPGRASPACHRDRPVPRRLARRRGLVAARLPHQRPARRGRGVGHAPPRPREPRPSGGKRPDFAGAGAATLGLAGVVFALIEGPAEGLVAVRDPRGLVGVGRARRVPVHRVRREVARSSRSTSSGRGSSAGPTCTTFAVYAGARCCALPPRLELQTVLGYSALAAGAATAPDHGADAVSLGPRRTTRRSASARASR